MAGLFGVVNTSGTLARKLHPAENGSSYKTLAEPIRKRLTILPRETSLDRALRKVSVAVIVHSTAGLEAMVAQKPLIVLGVSQTVEEFVWWPRLGGGYLAHSSEEAGDVLARLLTDRSCRRKVFAGKEKFLQK